MSTSQTFLDDRSIGATKQVQVNWFPRKLERRNLSNMFVKQCTMISSHDVRHCLTA